MSHLKTFINVLFLKIKSSTSNSIAKKAQASAITKKIKKLNTKRKLGFTKEREKEKKPPEKSKMAIKIATEEMIANSLSSFFCFQKRQKNTKLINQQTAKIIWTIL